MRLVALLLVLALAGCAEPSGGTFTVDIDARPPEEILETVEVPDGFVQEQAFAQKDGVDLVDGHVRTLGRGDWSQGGDRLILGLLLYGSHESAATSLRQLTYGPDGSTEYAPLEVGDAGYFTSYVRSSGRDHGGSSSVVARVDAYVFWVAYDAVGVDPTVDVEPIARDLAARLREH